MRLVVSLLIKECKLYRNIGFRKFQYLGDLKNILRLYRDCFASEAVLIDTDGSLSTPEFRKYIYIAISEANFPISIILQSHLFFLAKELISNGVERVGLQLKSESTYAAANTFIREFGSSTFIGLINSRFLQPLDPALHENIFKNSSLISEVLIQNTSLLGIRHKLDNYIKQIAKSLALFPPDIILGYNGGVSSLAEVELLHQLGFDAIYSGTYLSTSLYSPESIVPNYPFEWFFKQLNRDNNQMSAKSDDNHRECLTCLMNSLDPGFEAIGKYCNYCLPFKSSIFIKRSLRSRDRFKRLLNSIRSSSSQNGLDYDCVVGLSGGVDSSYVLHHCVEQGLNPVAVSMDNGWNDTTANSNIKRLCDSLGVRLITYVIDWEEYLHMLRAFLWSNVTDIEVLYDNACQGVCFMFAKRLGIKYILSGSNSETEGMLCPTGWTWSKTDTLNMKSIVRAYEASNNIARCNFKSYPYLSTLRRKYYERVKGIRWIKYLDYINYDKRKAIKLLEKSYGYRSYPQKHYENVMTRIYQGYILPKKFNIDKNRWHLSIEVASELITKASALEELNEANNADWSADVQYMCEKLRISTDEFSSYILTPRVSNLKYMSERHILDLLKAVLPT